MLAPLCFSCPRCLLLVRGGARLMVRVLADRKNGDDIEIPPEPTTCCMSGCANCVWLDYAQTLSKILDNNDERAREIVLSKITDPNLKAFLSIELRNLKLPRDSTAVPPGAAAASAAPAVQPKTSK